MVTIKSRVDGQIMTVISPRAGGQGRRSAGADRSAPVPGALEQVQAAKAKDEAQLASAQADLARYAALVGPGFQTRPEL